MAVYEKNGTLTYVDEYGNEHKLYPKTKVENVKGFSEAVSENRKLFTAALSAEWAGSEPPYTQTVSVPGILESDSPHIAPVYDSDRDTALEQMESWSLVTGAAAGADTLTFTCLEDKPQEKIPIQIEVIR